MPLPPVFTHNSVNITNPDHISSAFYSPDNHPPRSLHIPEFSEVSVCGVNNVTKSTQITLCLQCFVLLPVTSYSRRRRRPYQLSYTVQHCAPVEPPCIWHFHDFNFEIMQINFKPQFKHKLKYKTLKIPKLTKSKTNPHEIILTTKLPKITRK